MDKAQRLRLDRPVLVEGKYDKQKLAGIIDTAILTTDGFGIFKADEKRELIRRVAGERGIIVLTDSDGAGLVIRNFLRGILPPDRVLNLYIPEVEGKERRKKSPSKAGLLGVEGIDPEILRRLLEPYADTECASGAQSRARAVTKNDFYEDGLSGKQDSAAKRKTLARSLGLPTNMSSNALLEAINLLYTYDEYKEKLKL